ncbi:MAG: hypothetical protein AAGU05_02805, partial [Anaerolineaceae bacterium]
AQKNITIRVMLSTLQEYKMSPISTQNVITGVFFSTVFSIVSGQNLEYNHQKSPSVPSNRILKFEIALSGTL